jgi:hypothetical protein
MANQPESLCFDFSDSLKSTYDSDSKTLTLAHVDSASGRQVEIRLGPSNTRVLYNRLVAAAKLLKGVIGADSDDAEQNARAVPKEDPRAALRERIRAGEPFDFYEIDGPMTMRRDAHGGLVIDCPSLKIFGIDEAAIIRYRLTPVAMEGLYRVLSEIRTRPDAPPTDASPSAH